MGNILEFADGGLFHCCSVCCLKFLAWFSGCVVWSPNREGLLMRTNKVINYESILQVLGESGCPFCRFMKNFQAALLQDPTQKEIHHLCNFHTWGIAATQRG